jgi:hypothetical protein
MKDGRLGTTEDLAKGERTKRSSKNDDEKEEEN